MKYTPVGVDIAKHLIQVHFINEHTGEVVDKRLRSNRDTGWNVHHLLKKSLGGSDDVSNLVLLHPNCHRQLHSNDAGLPQGGGL
jgi:5-methylcytosine-specific restriction endonuclease McrA